MFLAANDARRVLIPLVRNLLQCLEHVGIFFTIHACKIGAQQEQSVGAILLSTIKNLCRENWIVHL